MSLTRRPWVPESSETLVQHISKQTASGETATVVARVERLAERNKEIHERDCFNLNPATNVMNPRAEAILAAGLGSRPSLGYPGDKYEMGLEAIEEIEIIAAELASEIFECEYAEIRVASGAMANLYGFMATCKAGDTIIAPSAEIGGHVTHHSGGCAGLYGLNTIAAPINADGYTIDLDELGEIARRERPKLITIGGSLNLFEHPVKEVRAIADEVGALVLFDAAHQCGIIAGKAWRNPLHEGAHLMTMSTYKSLGGPAGGLIVTSDANIAERLDAIAFPGMTANFDAAKSAALAITLCDWREHGAAYANRMIDLAAELANNISERGIRLFETPLGITKSHQFAIEAAPFGGGQEASRKLRKAGFLACGIGLPIAPVEGDLNGLRIGTPELARFGMEVADMKQLAMLISEALTSNRPEDMASRVAEWRRDFDTIHFVV